MVWPFVAITTGAGLIFKGVQALTDEEWPGTEFPAEFRHKLIERHWKWHGGRCLECDRTGLTKADFTVDHIVPIRRGGRNSKNNAQVMCGSCNSRKRDHVSLWDQFWGRGGKRPRRRQ